MHSSRLEPPVLRCFNVYFKLSKLYTTDVSSILPLWIKNKPGYIKHNYIKQNKSLTQIPCSPVLAISSGDPLPYYS